MDDHFASWLHIGDLHASEEDGWQSVRRLERLVDDVTRHVSAATFDFVFLPGDNANHGEREQYRRVAEALLPLRWPCRAIPGDHDVEPGNLDAFHEALAPQALPASIRVAGRRALFLDVVSAGTGGPDFRLGATQRRWLETELRDSRANAEPRPLVFMHAFPADLAADDRALGRLFDEARVAFVDTGHTHYNELLNDGSVIYAATRSTGQIEEDDGAAGFSVAAVDGDAASWRFKRLDAPWPFVMITSPADGRLVTRHASDDRSSLRAVRALVLGDDTASVAVAVDGGPAQPMTPVGDRPGRWIARLDADRRAIGRIVVEARDGRGRVTTDEIRLRRDRRAGDVPLGDHAASIGPWIEHGLLGTRLGPNANGRSW